MANSPGLSIQSTGKTGYFPLNTPGKHHLLISSVNGQYRPESLMAGSNTLNRLWRNPWFSTNYKAHIDGGDSVCPLEDFRGKSSAHHTSPSGWYVARPPLRFAMMLYYLLGGYRYGGDAVTAGAESERSIRTLKMRRTQQSSSKHYLPSVEAIPTESLLTPHLTFREIRRPQERQERSFEDFYRYVK